MSTNLQLKGDSLRRQTELSKAYAEEHGLHLVSDAELHDIGVSAFKGDNVTMGALGKFLESVKAGHIPEGSYLLVESLDRLSRQELLPSVQLLLDIIGLSINVVTLLDRKTYSRESADMASMMLSIALMSRAHEESQTKSRRVGAAWKAKRDRIADQKLTKICPAWLTLAEDRKSYIVDDDRQKVVMRIFEETDQGMGSYLVTKRLNQDKVSTFGKTTLWNQSYVTKILQNRAVIGEYQPHVILDGKRKAEGDPIPNYFPQIIEEGLFYRVQQARKLRRSGSAGRRGERQRNLFTNIAKCGYCGSPMRLINKGEGPKGGVYLKCRKALLGGDCASTSWKYEDFEKSFFFFAREIDFDGALNAAAKLQAAREWELVRSGLVAKLDYEKLGQARLLDLLNDERQDMDLLRERLANATASIRRLQEQIDNLPAPNEEQAVKEISAPELLELIASVQTDGAVETRIKLAAHLKKLVKSVHLRPDGVFLSSSRKSAGRQQPITNELDQDAPTLVDRMEMAFERDQPQFDIVFADRRSRFVRVRRGRPTELIEMAATDDKSNYGRPPAPQQWGENNAIGWYTTKEKALQLTEILVQELASIINKKTN